MNIKSPQTTKPQIMIPLKRKEANYFTWTEVEHTGSRGKDNGLQLAWFKCTLSLSLINCLCSVCGFTAAYISHWAVFADVIVVLYVGYPTVPGLLGLWSGWAESDPVRVFKNVPSLHFTNQVTNSLFKTVIVFILC